MFTRLALLTTVACLAAASFPSNADADSPRQGLPWDWSHRVHVYNADLPDEAIAKGRWDQWLEDSRDPRFMTRVLKKYEARLDREEDAALIAGKPMAKSLIDRIRARLRGRGSREAVSRDWSHVMGGASGVGVKGVFPAKYGYDLSTTPSCSDDFVVYTSGAAGATGSGNRGAKSGTVTGDPGGNTVTITNGTRVLTLTGSTTLNDGLNFLRTGSNTARATNIAAAINRNGGLVGVTATSAGAVVTVTSMTQGASAITVAETLANFAWTGGAGALTGGSGTAGQPTIFAFNDIYKTTCGGISGSAAVPQAMWSYNTGTGAVAETSPVLSLDGTQVAFIERSGTTASLVLVKWSSTASVGTVGAPTVPATAASGAAYRTCTAPCMFKMSLGVNNVTSSPYYDYAGDSLYVGSAAGTLHRFNGVFIGTPAAAGTPWPVTVAAGRTLSSPVYDGSTGLVFVGSDRGASTAVGGRLHSVDAAGTVASTALLAGSIGGAGSTGVFDAPIVDSSAERVYAFVASDTDTGCIFFFFGPCHAVFQFPTNVSLAGATGTSQQMGMGNAGTRTVYSGVFGDDYWASSPASPTGYLYVCAAAYFYADRPTLWRIPITANVMGAPQAGPQLVGATSTGECSPPTEVMNGTDDYLFVSVPANGADTGCTGACIYMYNLSTITWGTGAAASAGLAAPGGTGGIIIDNISTVTGASQVYYSTRASPGNAIQASQAALN